jgi:drug/metabolite transporter (DMT)-like permease
LGALVAVILWGISFVATKAALREIHPLTLIAVRFAIGNLLLFSMLAARRMPLLPPRREWPILALLGFDGIALHTVIQAYALRETTAVRTGWLIGLSPIWSACLAAIFLRERLGWVKSLGLGIGFAGALLVVTRGAISRETLALPSTRGDLLIFASTFNWAIYTVISREPVRRVGSLPAMATAMLVGWLLLSPWILATHAWRELSQLSAAGWGAVLFLGIGCSGLAYLLWFSAIERIDASRVSALLYLEPLVTLAAAVILLHEPVLISTIVGGLLVLVGVALVQRGHARREPVAARPSGAASHRSSSR